MGVPVGAWFVPVQGDPGPPYGKAYGHWKKHKRNPKAAVVLVDADIRNLVAVRVIHEYYGVPVKAAMEWRASGRDLRNLVSDEYHRRHGKGGSHPGHHENKPHGKKQGSRGKDHR